MPRALLAGLLLLLMAGHHHHYHQQIHVIATSPLNSSKPAVLISNNNNNKSTTTISSSSLSSSFSSSTAVKKRNTVEEDLPPTPLEIINPWLSACDLQPSSATDLQGSCSATMWTATAGMSTCPRACTRGLLHDKITRKSNSTINQCLFYLEESHKDTVCRGYSTPEERRDVLGTLRMHHCCEHSVLSTLLLHGDRQHIRNNYYLDEHSCGRTLEALLEVDALAARMSCEFAEVLSRYDCGQNYSIANSCNDCQEAYRQWVCSSLVPHFVTGHNGAVTRLRPCRSVCQNVEQRCPYMLPGDRAPAHPTQYAGEPTFLCLDPNIPETGEQRLKSAHGDDDCCYNYCGSASRGPCIQCPRVAPPAEHFNDTPVPVRCAAGTAPPKSQNCKQVSAGSPSSAAVSSAHTIRAASTHSRRACVWWTACIVVLAYTRTVLDVLLRCLLVLCAKVIRTSLFSRIKTKWRWCS